MNAKEVIAELTYVNYAYNRAISPNITPEQWAKLYGPSTQAMEERYQAEKAKTAAISNLIVMPKPTTGVNQE